MRHDAPEQAHAPKRMVGIADSQCWDVIALLGLDPCRPARSASDHDQLCVDCFRDVGCIVSHCGGDRVHSRREACLAILRHRLEHSLGAQHDPVHGVDRNDGEVTNGGFAAQHAGVRTIQNGVGNVACFSPCWTSVMVHALQHLRRDDHGL